MRKYIILAVLVVIIVIGALGVATIPSPPAMAHETRQNEQFIFVVGFQTEPAYEGTPNAAYIAIQKAHSHSSQGADDTGHGMEDMDHEAGATGEQSSEYTHGQLITATLPIDSKTIIILPEAIVGQTLSYHVHTDPRIPEVAGLNDLEGNITVIPAGSAADSAITIGPNGFEPATAQITAGSHITLLNESGSPITIMNNPLTIVGAAAAGQEAASATQPIVANLQVEVEYPATGDSATYPVLPLVGGVNEYTAEFVPTLPGTYGFRFFGTIDGVAIDEGFTGGSTTFDDVQSLSQVQFPVTVASNREVANVAATALETAQQNNQLLPLIWSSLTLSIISLLLVGGFGGYMAVLYLRQKRATTV